MMHEVILSASRKLLYLPHAVKQMSRPDRIVTADEVRNAVLNGKIIEAYPDDQRGASCLILHQGPERAIHVVCAPKSEYLAIITAYLPAPEQWSMDFKVRR